MSFMRIPFLYLLLLSMLAISSCGDDDDSGGGGTTVQQEQACPDPTETANIQSILNNLSNGGSVEGSSTLQRISENGSSTTENFPSTTYDFSRVSEDSWITEGERCTQSRNCTDTEATASLRDGCFFYDDIQASVNSATPDTFDFTTEGEVQGVPSTVNTILTLAPDGQVTISENVIQNGRTTQTFRFNGAVRGSGGTTTGGTTTGGTTTGGTTTGGTTPREPFEVPEHDCSVGEPVCPDGFFGACEIETFEDGSSEIHATCYPEE